MRTIQSSVAGQSTAPLGSTFVVMVGEEACVVRATGVRPIADVLCAPEAELLGWEEMAGLGAIDQGDVPGLPPSGGMIAAPRLRRRRDRSTASRALLLARPHD